MSGRLLAAALALALTGCGDTGDDTDAGGSDAGAPDAGAIGFFGCDPRDVTCRAAPPSCMPGFVPIVEGECWGACGQAAGCRPIECEEATSMTDCPDGWGCVLGSCRPPR